MSLFERDLQLFVQTDTHTLLRRTLFRRYLTLRVDFPKSSRLGESDHPDSGTSWSRPSHRKLGQIHPLGSKLGRFVRDQLVYLAPHSARISRWRRVAIAAGAMGGMSWHLGRPVFRSRFHIHHDAQIPPACADNTKI